MAGPAGFPVFHRRHSNRAVSSRLEQAWMAFAAQQFFGVGFVNKGNVPGWLHPEYDVLDRMAAATGRKGKGDLAVAGPAGFAVFHFGHGYGALALSFVDFIVTDLAVIINSRSLRVHIMAENDCPTVTGFEDDIKNIRCKNGNR